MEKNINNNGTKSFPNVSISWYPGHMAKTKQNMINDLKLIDIVIEVLDARIPISSQNSDLEKVMQNKKKIIILNKADLADDNVTANWVKRFKENKIIAISVESNNRKFAKRIIDVIKKESIEITEEYAKKGRATKRIRVMVFGIPNVGKSTFINLLAGKNIVKSENRPGVTRANQWIKIAENIDLMDTPGMLWPKIDNEKVKLNLAFTNSIPENIIDNEEVAFYLLKYLVENYKNNVEKRYGITIDEKDIIDNNKVIEVRKKIAIKTGARLSGGNIDEMKVSNIILNDFRSGKLGKISLE